MTLVPSQVGVGWTVYALDIESPEVVVEYVRGGTVIAVESAADEVSGEIRRRFITAKAWRGSVSWDSMAEQDVGSWAEPSRREVWFLVKMLGTTVGRARKFSRDVNRCITAQFHLLRSLEP